MKQKLIRFRLYWDKDKEEQWLNQMSRSGYAMNRYFLGIYVFEACEPGEYIYRIDLLDQEDKSLELDEYIEILEDTGAECVGHWFWWYFFRKKSSNGEFELYTDKESKIEHYRSIQKFFRFFSMLETVCLAVQLPDLWMCILGRREEIVSTLLFTGLLAVIVTAMWGIYLRTGKKIKELENDVG